MKIKLEAQNGVTVLLVSGPIAAPELDVLKAGVTKLLAEGKFPLQINVTQAEIPADLAPRVKLLAEETRLLGAVAAATTEKARTLKTLDETAALGAEIKKLRRESGELRAMITLLEAQVDAQVKSRKPPLASEAVQESLDDVHSVIRKVFSDLFQEKAG